jgi:hypothetical protein
VFQTLCVQIEGAIEAQGVDVLISAPREHYPSVMISAYSML